MKLFKRSETTGDPSRNKGAKKRMRRGADLKYISSKLNQNKILNLAARPVAFKIKNFYDALQLELKN